MKRTRICELLEVEYPIIQGGMFWIANAELAAAVSNAGGLGTISPSGGATYEESWAENLRRQLRNVKALTDKPFGVNIPLPFREAEESLNVALEEGVRVITTSGGSPALYTKRIKQSKAIVMHLAFTVRQACRAEVEGVDVVIAEGSEAGGLIGPEEVSTFTLVPQVVDAVKIPVVAAALALGAEGVQMGTRFLVTKECLLPLAYKEMMLKIGDADTIVIRRRSNPARILKNELAKKILGMEASGVADESLEEFTKRCRLGVEGDLEEGPVLCGATAGMITEIPSAGEVVRWIVANYPKVMAGLG